MQRLSLISLQKRILALDIQHRKLLEWRYQLFERKEQLEKEQEYILARQAALEKKAQRSSSREISTPNVSDP